MKICQYLPLMAELTKSLASQRHTCTSVYTSEKEVLNEGCGKE